MIRQLSRTGSTLVILLFAAVILVQCSGSSPTDPGDSGGTGALNSTTGESTTGTGDGTVGEDDPEVVDAAGIDIEKSTNGADADNPPGPSIPVGDPILWEYVVSNTGDVTLVDVVVSDDQGAAVSCPADTLDPGASMTCTATGTAEPGQYANIGRAEAPDPNNPGSTVLDEDPSHYFGQESIASIDIEKSTNGDDADGPPGPTIPVGDPVLWEYTVTNTGPFTLVDVVVTDDQGVAVSCPTDFLNPGDSMTCTASGTAETGQYANIGRAEAPDPNNPGSSVFDEDPSHYFGEQATAGIDIEKSTNGNDADVPPGPAIPVGDPVLWEYTVTNTGGVTLVDVMVTDDQGVAVSCPSDTLDAGVSMICTADGTAELGQYANIGRAEAPDPNNPGSSVFDEDPSHYFGEEVLDCTQAYPSTEELWPPNHKMEDVTVEGIDSVGGSVSITIDSIFQDEPVNGTGDGDTWPDGEGIGTAVAGIRAERAGGLNGRFYHLGFTADNGMGSTCNGEVLVSVPKSRSHPAVDEGPLYDSTAAP